MASVSRLRQSRGQRGTVKIQSPQLAVECGPAHAKRFSRRSSIPPGAHERSLQHRTLGHGKAVGDPLRHAKNLRRGQWLLQACLGKSKRLARHAISPYDKVVLIDSDQGFPRLVGNRNDLDARSRIGKTETFGFDPRSGIDHGRRNEIDKAFDQVCPAGRYVERPDEMPFVIVKRGSCTAQPRIARIEMLIAMDRQRTMFDEAGTDAVCTFAVFAPDRARPQSPAQKRRIVARRASPLDGNAVPVRKQHTAASASNGGVQSVEARLGDLNERVNLLPGLP